MIAVLGGLLAAVAWAIANVGSTRSAHLVGAFSTVAVTTSIGLVFLIPLIVAAPVPTLGPNLILGAVTGGFGGVIGLLFSYRAFRIGRVAIVAPIISAQGAVSAVLTVLAGESLSPIAGAMLAVVAAGVAAVALGSRPSEVAADAGAVAPEPPLAVADTGIAAEPPVFRSDIDQGASLRVLTFATLGSVFFGLALFGTGQLAAELPLAWVALPSRLVGAALILAPLAATRRFRADRRAIPWAIAVGCLDLVGTVVFTLGARESTAITSVFASQVAVVSVVGAAIFLRERPTRIQVLGLAVVALGTAVLALSRT